MSEKYSNAIRAAIAFSMDNLHMTSETAEKLAKGLADNYVKNNTMCHYIGTKQILAKPMTRGKYNNYRQWTIPENENADEQGYLVEYLDGGKSNHREHTGYISWSPKDVFEKSYKSTSEMGFGEALILLKEGKPVRRKSWDGNFIYIRMMSYFDSDPRKITSPGYLVALTQDDIEKWPTYSEACISSSDALASDWEYVPLA